MRRIFYKVEKNTYDEGSFNGLVTIRCYTIEGDDLKLFFEVETTDESPFTIEEEIQLYLVDNGYGDEEFIFKQI